MEDLRGRVAVVTGGGSGMGRATCLALAARGVHVVVADLDGPRTEAVAAEIAARGGEGLGVPCDVSQDAEVAALRTSAVEHFGEVDIVMSNVGVLTVGNPEDIPMSAWRRMVETNLLSVARGISVFLPSMLERGAGHIVNTASTAGLWAYSYERLPYSATKAAVVAMSEALALYARPRGVGVTCLCPGPVKTNIGEQIEWFGGVRPLHGPPLEPIEAAVVGEQVVQAILDGTFLLLTHPAETHAILVERAEDPESFLAAQVARM